MAQPCAFRVAHHGSVGEFALAARGRHKRLNAMASLHLRNDAAFQPSDIATHLRRSAREAAMAVKAESGESLVVDDSHPIDCR